MDHIEDPPCLVTAEFAPCRGRLSSSFQLVALQRCSYPESLLEALLNGLNTALDSRLLLHPVTLALLGAARSVDPECA